MRPLAIFFVVGFALFGLKRGLLADQAEPQPLRVHVRKGASPVEIEHAVERALLAELGLRSGAPLRDPVIRERLMASLGEAGAPLDEAALLHHAEQLGLWHEDAFLEARLAMVGELGLSGLRSAAPDDAALLALRDAHPERYASPARVSFTQLFLARERHGAALREHALSLRARLIAEHVGPDAAHAHSEASNLPARVADATESQVASRFGAEFTDALARLAPGGWSEPLPSAFGVHLVWLSARRPAGLLDLSRARPRLIADLREQRARHALQRKLAELRADYAIEVLQ